MLSQFRKHYPEGSLVSELVTIDHGKYIVRVSLQNKGITLGTGLAADNKIEIAEDRAIERALNSLILDNKPIESSEKIVSLPQQNSEPKPTVEVLSPTPEKPLEPVSKKEVNQQIEEIKKEEEPTLVTSTKSSKKRVKSSSNSKKVEAVEPEIKEEPLPIPKTPQEPAIEEKPLPIPETPQEPAIEENPLPIAETIQEPAIEENQPVVEEPLDFSEIIARSNAELKRLKWTTEQGREYLIKTYGKRSRQVLSDEELLEFLRYLESLPTPS
ncbi:MAG: hypothetical protein QNJ37_05975 [Crocosphaera sp.]|nr:hypothetical protein [Crocosphaera sp.]